MAEPDLDAWLPDPAIRTRHRRTARATPDDLWQAAETVRIADARTLGRVVRWRIPGVPGDQTFRELFRTAPFTVLAEGALVSETRAAAVDRRSALRLRALWTVVGQFERLIGGEALRIAARRAERA